MSKPKKVNFELIPPKPVSEPYRIMNELITKYHHHLRQAGIALAWRRRFHPDPDGRLVLGRCVKASDLQRELVEWDFVILLNSEVWSDPSFTLDKKTALIDHELCHAEVVRDSDDLPKEDERGRRVYRTRKHDIEEFREIVARHGLYKADLESFAETIMRKQQSMFVPEEAVQDGKSAAAQ